MSWTWCVTIVALTGTVLNIRRCRTCFAFWLVSNCAWAVYDWRIGAYAQACQMGVYAGLAVWGWFAWKKSSPLRMAPTPARSMGHGELRETIAALELKCQTTCGWIGFTEHGPLCACRLLGLLRMLERGWQRLHTDGQD